MKIFSKIRHKFILERNIVKYLKYAFGEIILVALGILIALFINNWNQDRLAEENAYKYLSQIKTELKADSEFFDTVNVNLSNRISVFEAVIDSNFENDSLVLELAHVVAINTGPREFGTSFKNLVNTNGANLIKEVALISRIQNYYVNKCFDYNRRSEYHTNFNIKNIEGYLLHSNLKDINGKFILNSLKKEIEYGSLVSIVHWQNSMSQSIINTVVDCNKEAKEIIVQIEKIEKSKANT